VSRTPATEHTLASFPLDSISKVECEVEWSFSEHPCVGATTLPRVANTTHHRYMTQLVPSRSTDSSTIMITFQNSEFGTELTRYDYGTFETPLPSNRNFSKSSLIAIATNQDDYVCIARGQGHGMKTLLSCLLGPSRPHKSHKSQTPRNPRSTGLGGFHTVQIARRPLWHAH
jgi:hypothetical protein